MTGPGPMRFAEADEGDLDSLARLALGSFPRSPRDHAAWKRTLGEMHEADPSTLWVAYREERPIAFCLLHSMRQGVRGALLPICGVGLVSVSIAARRQGVGRALVEAGIRRARERGDLGSALFPFRGSFYERLGYGWAGEVDQVEVSPGALPRGRADVVRLMRPSEMEQVRGCYDRWLRGENGQIARPEPTGWEGVLRDGAQVVGTAGESGIAGYAVVVTAGATLDVREIVWESPRARDDLLGWLASVGDQYEKVRLRAHPRERLVDRLVEVRSEIGGNVPGGAGWELWFPASARLRGPMFRLIDLRRAFAACRWPEEGRFGLRLRDGLLGENGGDWTIEIEGGRADARPGTGGGDPIMECSIATASRLFIGDLTPSEAAASGLGSAPQASLAGLDNLMRTERPWTFQRF